MAVGGNRRRRGYPQLLERLGDCTGQHLGRGDRLPYIQGIGGCGFTGGWLLLAALDLGEGLGCQLETFAALAAPFAELLP